MTIAEYDSIRTWYANHSMVPPEFLTRNPWHARSAFSNRPHMNDIGFSVPKPVEVYVYFFASINNATASRLLGLIESGTRDSINKMHLFISTPGGTVAVASALHTALTHAPFEVTTSNYGNVDSAGILLFCAGSERFMAPESRFLLHRIHVTLPQNMTFDEKSAREQWRKIQYEQDLTANVLCASSNLQTEQVREMMQNGTIILSEQAKECGLVHHTDCFKVPHGAYTTTIDDYSTEQRMLPLPHHPLFANNDSRTTHG